MKALVTGAAGFIGSHLCDKLLLDGHAVIGIDNMSVGHMDNLHEAMKFGAFSFFQTDVCNIEIWNDLFDGVDWVFHLAARADIVPSISDPSEYYRSNVTGTFKILEASRNWKVRRFIYAASSSCYGIPNRYPTPEIESNKPQYPYALTKMMGEEMVFHWNKVYKLPALSLRLFNAYGPRARTSGTYGAVMGVFLAQLANGLPLTVVGDGEQRRDFTFVTDVVGGLIRAAESDITGCAINIGSGDTYSINHLISLLGAKETVQIPKRPGEPNCTFADIDRARGMLKYKPQVSFEQGVAHMRGLIEKFKDAPKWTPETIEKETKEWFAHLQ